MIGVSVQSISKYENGHQTPKLDVLHTLASTLKMPRAYFMRPMRVIDEAPVFWRGKLSAPPLSRDRAAVRLEWLKEVIDYIGSYFDLPRLDVPSFDISNIETIGQDDIEAFAKAIRSHWDIRPGPMPDVIERLETNGILVSRIHVGVEKLDAFSQWSDGFGIPFVVLGRDKASAVRQRFDALHELAHIVLHKSVPARRLNDRAFYNAVERQADRLASSLLLPEREFLEELYAPSLDGFLALKERWGASVGAMIMRCQAVDIIDEDAARRMWINYNRRGWKGNEPLDSKIEKETPHLIRRSFEMLISEGVQSASEILSALPFPASDLEELADLPAGLLSGQSQSRAEPTFKSELKDAGNVVSMFSRRG
ncbi:MAG: ImmA/IrrE family metallo-endopeptidase, partial [Rhizorhabdus sp.]|uniref:XRE family transcriptional regulator n=1 Tax=Rhizorhabdus sp. TaxID=1968843 RepID=UPI001B3F2EAA